MPVVNPSRQGNHRTGLPPSASTNGSDGPFYIACANDRLYRRLVAKCWAGPISPAVNSATGVRGRPTGETARDPHRNLRARPRENWVAKMKSDNIPVGYLRTVEEAFNSPEVRSAIASSQIPHPAAGTVPNIEPPIHSA